MEEAIEELSTAKTELATAKRKLVEAEGKLVTVQTEYDNQIDNLTPKTIEKLKRAQIVADRCTDVVTSKESMVVSKQSVLTNLEIHARSLSAAAAPGKFER